MGYAVRNDGSGGHAVTSAAECAADETYFATVPGQPAAQIAAIALSASVQAALAAGLTISSVSTPAINGTYALDPATQFEINSVQLFIQTNGDFPGGASVYPWFDLSGVAHIFPSVAVFKEWATAIANYVAGLKLYRAGAPGASLPAPGVTIA